MNRHLPDPTRRALEPFAPPARVFPERIEDTSGNGNHMVRGMRAYMVRVIDRKSGAVREMFEAMASDSVTCVNQHLDHALEGEKLDVMALEAFRAQQVRPAPFTEEELLQGDRDRQQMKDQQCASLTRACDERAMRRETFGSELDRATWMRQS